MRNISKYQEVKELPLRELMDLALQEKLSKRGLDFGLCTITNAKSGACTENCAFCAQSSRAQGSAPVYGFKDVETILREAEEAAQAGAKRFSIVTSGRGPGSRLLEKVARCVEEIKKKVGIRVCASLGIIDEEGLKILKEAGLSRYHHNLESPRSYFDKVCSTHSFQDRVRTVECVKRVGLEVCSGGIIGLGESEEERFELAAELSRLEVDSCPINLLVPIPGTPLEAARPLSLEEILRTVAIFRLMLPGAAIRVAGGREKVLADAQILAFLAGADAMLIGGYLTTRGRKVEMDLDLVFKVKEIWQVLRRS